MQELFGYLILFVIGVWLFFSVILPFFLVLIVTTIIGVGSAASLHGFWNGGKSFIVTTKRAWQNAEDRPLSNPIAQKINNLYGSEPAFLLPIYDKYWSFMIYVSREIWSDVYRAAMWWFNIAQRWWDDASSKDWFKGIVLRSAAVGAIIGGVFHYIATFFIVAIAILCLLAIIIGGVFLSSTIMVFFALFNKLYGFYYQISYVCPTCHEPMKIPTHICDNCGTEHKKLRPSVYGIRYHSCNGTKSRGVICNQKLVTFGKARAQLSKRCPHCNSPVEGLGGTNIHFPLVGGRGVGKSHFITMSLMKLIDNAPTQKLEITFPDAKHQSSYQRNKALLKKGQRLQATKLEGNDGAIAFNLQVKKVNQKIPTLLYLYDAAGEIWNQDDTVEQQRYFKYLHGVIFIIDPFAIKQVCDTYNAQLLENPGIIQHSNDDIETIIANVIAAFEQRLNVKSTQKFYQPIAVVMNKCDAFDLDEKIGQKAAIEYIQRYPEVKTEAEAIHRVVKNFLENHASNFLQILEGRFANIRYFSCSSIGYGNNDAHATKFEGERVLEPMLWLMAQAKVLSGQPPLITRVFSRR